MFFSSFVMKKGICWVEKGCLPSFFIRKLNQKQQHNSSTSNTSWYWYIIFILQSSQITILIPTRESGLWKTINSRHEHEWHKQPQTRHDLTIKRQWCDSDNKDNKAPFSCCTLLKLQRCLFNNVDGGCSRHSKKEIPNIDGPPMVTSAYIIIKPSQKVMSQRSKISQSVPLPAIPTTADHNHNPQLAPLSKPSTALSATTSMVTLHQQPSNKRNRNVHLLQFYNS
jgi:hypothetical protein